MTTLGGHDFPAQSALLSLIEAAERAEAAEDLSTRVPRRGRHFLWFPSTTAPPDTQVSGVLLIETNEASQARLELAFPRTAVEGALEFEVLKPQVARTIRRRLSAAPTIQ